MSRIANTRWFVLGFAPMAIVAVIDSAVSTVASRLVHQALTRAHRESPDGAFEFEVQLGGGLMTSDFGPGSADFWLGGFTDWQISHFGFMWPETPVFAAVHLIVLAATVGVLAIALGGIERPLPFTAGFAALSSASALLFVLGYVASFDIVLLQGAVKLAVVLVLSASVYVVARLFRRNPQPTSPEAV